METYRGVLGAIKGLAIFGVGFICGAYVSAKAALGGAQAMSYLYNDLYNAPADTVTYEVD